MATGRLFRTTGPTDRRIVWNAAKRRRRAGGTEPPTPPLTALAQILALDPTALWWPTEATMTVARDGTGAAPVAGEPVGRMLDLTPNAINAIAPGDSNRPLLGRVPVTGRRNLLTYTEQFDNVAWNKTSSAIDVSAYGGTTPDGQTSGFEITEPVSTSSHAVRMNMAFISGQVYTFSVFAKKSNSDWCQLLFGAASFPSLYQNFNLATGEKGAGSGFDASLIDDVGDGWYRISITATATATAATDIYIALTDNSDSSRLLSYTGDGTSGVYIWGAQVETGSTATAYQRVVTALDVTEAGVADAEYLLLDKVDDVLNATMPATTGKMVLATPEGTAVYGVNISAGSYDVGGRGGDYFPGTSLVGQTIGDFTDEEAASIAAIFRAAGGGDDYGGVTNFNQFWRNWSELTSFPVIDTSSGTSFYAAWYQCSSLTTFPALDVSSGTNFYLAWLGCTSLTSFPLLDVSSGTNFTSAWQNCANLTTFPALDLSSATNFIGTWQNCSSLTTFPANMFDTVTAIDFTNAFRNTNLSQTSIDNILVSINTAGTSGGTFNQTNGSAPSATGEAAIDALRGRGWTVTVTGGY